MCKTKQFQLGIRGCLKNIQQTYAYIQAVYVVIHGITGDHCADLYCTVVKSHTP